MSGGKMQTRRVGGWMRDQYGCIATLQDEDGTRFSLYMPGRRSVEAVVFLCRAKGWRIVCLSTPETIHRDLQGTRAELTDREPLSWQRPGAKPDRLNLPERSMLSRAKGLDLLVRS